MRRRLLVGVLLLGALVPVTLPAAGHAAATGTVVRAADGDAPERPVRPVDGPVLRPFSAPSHPFAPGHRGVDLQARAGEPVRSVRGGRVAFAGTVAGTAWVTVDHGSGLSTTYGNVVAGVHAGARVRAGDVLGSLATGAAHLDWGARVARMRGPHRYVDPLLLLVDLRPVLVAPAR